MRFTIGMAFGPPEHYVPVARAADALGYWGIACSDHVLNLETLSTPYPYTPDGQRRWELQTNWLDPWVAIGAMGSATERLRFTTNVYVLPMRNPFVTAKAVATASVLTGGRVSLAFALPDPGAVDAAYAQLVGAGHHGELAPFDAFWGMRYATVHDPDGTGVDLFAPLTS